MTTTTVKKTKQINFRADPEIPQYIDAMRRRTVPIASISEICCQAIIEKYSREMRRPSAAPPKNGKKE